MKLASAIYNDCYPFDSFGMFTDFKVASHDADLDDADALVVWGGEDISPSLYNQAVHPYTSAGAAPSRRDRIEWGLMHAAKERGIPIIGICRGAQMLCAFAGGTLYQHVNNHGVGRGHEAVCDDGSIIVVSSLHHQMMNPTNTDHDLIAWSKEIRSDVHLDSNGDNAVQIEPEYVYFNKVKGHAIQWHPEFQSKDDPANIWLKDRWNKLGL